MRGKPIKTENSKTLPPERSGMHCLPLTLTTRPRDGDSSVPAVKSDNVSSMYVCPPYYREACGLQDIGTNPSLPSAAKETSHIPTKYRNLDMTSRIAASPALIIYTIKPPRMASTSDSTYSDSGIPCAGCDAEPTFSPHKRSCAPT